jgi:hypothetical protein
MTSKKSGSSQPIAGWRKDPVAFITEVLRNPETGQAFELYPAQIEFLRRAFTLAGAELAAVEETAGAPERGATRRD